MIATQTLLTENALAEEFVSAFQERRLAEKFFYWFPLSVRAWLALCSDGAYRNYVRSRSLIARSADELAGRLAPRPLEVLRRGARAAPVAAPRGPAHRGRRAVRRRDHPGRLRQSAQPSLRVGPVTRGRDPGLGRRAGVRSPGRHAPPGSPRHRQAFPRRPPGGNAWR